MAFNELLDNPYSPKIQDYRSETPTLSSLIIKGVEKKLLRVHTCIPGAITKVLGNQKVNVQPLLQKRYVDPQGTDPNGILIDLPEIQSVPVIMPMGSDYYLKLPIAEGDTGAIIFAERSIDAWLAGLGGDKTVDPGDTRHHDLSDAIFVPGLFPFGSQTTDETNDLIVKNGQAQIKLQKDGDILLGGNVNPAVLGDILVNALNDLSSALETLTTAISTGPIGVISSPVPGSPVPTNPAIIAAVVAFQASLTLFINQYLATPATNILSQQTFLERTPNG